jgi:hypothetical protein
VKLLDQAPPLSVQPHDGWMWYDNGFKMCKDEVVYDLGDATQSFVSSYVDSQVSSKADLSAMTSALDVKRDFTDFNIYGDPLSSDDMKFKFKAVGKNEPHQVTEGIMTIDPLNPTLTWIWSNGSTRCKIEYIGDGIYLFIYEYLSDGENQFSGQFTLPISEPKWSCEYSDSLFDFTIASSKGTIATQEWVLAQLSSLQSRIAELESRL